MNRNPQVPQTSSATQTSPNADRMLRDLAFVLKLTRETVSAIQRETPARRRKVGTTE